MWRWQIETRHVLHQITARNKKKKKKRLFFNSISRLVEILHGRIADRFLFVLCFAWQSWAFCAGIVLTVLQPPSRSTANWILTQRHVSRAAARGKMSRRFNQSPSRQLVRDDGLLCQLGLCYFVIDMYKIPSTCDVCEVFFFFLLAATKAKLWGGSNTHWHTHVHASRTHTHA